MATAADTSVLRALVGARGELLRADPPLAALQQDAGGVVGGPLLVPPLAAIARLALRLDVPLSRPVRAASARGMVDMWVKARPDGDVVELAIVDWRPAPLIQPDAAVEAERQSDLIELSEGWSWQVDAALRFVLADPAEEADALRPAPGERLTELFRLTPDEDGGLPILIAVAQHRPFSDQRAVAQRAQQQAWLLSGFPLFDVAGRLLGYRGKARLDEAEPAPPPPVSDRVAEQVIDSLFGPRLDRAMRMPLGRIIANADSISSRLQGPLRQEYATYASDIAAAGRHLMELVDDLADLQAVERPDFQPLSEPVDLADIARRTVGLLTVRAADRRITIDGVGEGESVPAVGEFRRVLQILVNLVGNAVRYSPEGGHVRVTATGGEGRALVSVTDEGSGIAEEDQARIFDKFERLGREESGGSGLGLYIARRLARAMGGDIGVESTPGQGSRFTLVLPTG